MKVSVNDYSIQKIRVLGLRNKIKKNLLADEIRDPVIWEKITVNVDEYLHMSDAAFKLHFRMTTDVFEVLLKTACS